MVNRKAEHACVLLSGGLDSSAALCWTRLRYPNVIAVMFDYGQPNRNQELTAGHRLTDELRISRLGIVVADTMPRARGILRSVEDDDGRVDGVSPAFVPGRNLIFLSSAAAHAACLWPSGYIDVVIGANASDAARFPDCRTGFFLRAGEALRQALARDIAIVTPWIDRTKAQILASLDDADRARVARSWSCYRGGGPCGRCAPCVARAAAFASSGVIDMSAEARMSGGDPSRERSA